MKIRGRKEERKRKKRDEWEKESLEEGEGR